MKINFKPSENITHWVIYYIAAMALLCFIPMLLK